MTRLWVLFSVVGIAVACGTSAKTQGAQRAQYETALQAASRPFTEMLNVLGDGNTFLNQPPAQQAAKLERAQKLLLAAARDLAHANAPADVKGDNAQIISSLRRLAALTGHFKAVFATGDYQKAATAAGAIAHSQALLTLRKAAVDLRRHGYRAPLIGSAISGVVF
jgi:hypothetical protein